MKYKECKEEGKNLEGKERLRFSIQKSIRLQDEIRIYYRKLHDLEYDPSFLLYYFQKKDTSDIYMKMIGILHLN